MLSRSIRRIATDWKAHLGFYVHFNAPTWCFKTEFGSRIIPTRRTVEPLPASNAAPIGPVMTSSFHDADGESVRAKAQEEKREEGEQQLMGVEDERSKHAESIAMPEVATTATSNTVQAPQPVQVGVQDEELDMSFLEDMVPQGDLGDGNFCLQTILSLWRTKQGYGIARSVSPIFPPTLTLPLPTRLSLRARVRNLWNPIHLLKPKYF